MDEGDCQLHLFSELLFELVPFVMEIIDGSRIARGTRFRRNEPTLIDLLVSAVPRIRPWDGNFRELLERDTQTTEQT